MTNSSYHLQPSAMKHLVYWVVYASIKLFTTLVGDFAFAWVPGYRLLVSLAHVCLYQ